ncbi:uncharacterized protein LOC108607497 [Drosophila busckii]|uniref:uncharacterized protein LOC108607497 n=1 Tax=Drosophila busckii TaxID=30019 RepID=UPI00083E9B61|nr:uncharacterized protein LOC108607497 [Drosophila busckii]
MLTTHLATLIICLLTLPQFDCETYSSNSFAILRHKAHPRKCVLDTAKGQLILRTGETKRVPDKCAEIYCGRYSWALIYDCVDEDLPDECDEWGDYKDLQAEFPNCCKRYMICNNVLS